uniref:B-type lectin plumieribetin-like n=1 Tax=Centroberyx gerrardi TaxID=166262 RepID=UPI003AAB7E69
MSKSSISTNQELRKGDYLLSNDGNHKAIFQEDGNFAIYKGGSHTWATETASSQPIRILLQQDNNLVMYTKRDEKFWETATASTTQSERMRLTLTNQGHLVLDKNGQTIWTSANSSGNKN